MGNCLKTQLKEVVNNDNLEVLNAFTFDVFSEETPDYSKRSLGLALQDSTDTAKATVISGNIHFTNSDGTADLGNEVDIIGQSNVIYFSNGIGKVRIISKYKIVNINWNYTSSRFMSIDVSKLAYLGADTSVSALVINNASTKLEGNISEFILTKPLVEFNITGNTYLTGTLPTYFKVNSQFRAPSTLISCTASQLANTGATGYIVGGNQNITGLVEDTVQPNVRDVYIEGTSITGTVETFYERMWATGLRNGVVTVRCTNCYFNNKKEAGVKLYVGTFSVSGISVTCNGSDAGTYNGSTWTYNS